MNLHEIDKLLDRYFEGETSLNEEQQLRDFFASGNVPERWKDLEKYFDFIDAEASRQIDDPHFDEKIMSAIKEEKPFVLLDLRRPWIYWLSGAAAIILILIAVLVNFNPLGKTIGDTYDNPQTAYVEARKILLYVSAKFNKGTSQLAPVKAFETGLNELKPVSAFSNATVEVKRLNNLEKVSKLITRN
jgi:hypothetical protein